MSKIEDIFLKFYSLPFKRPFAMLDTEINHKKGFLVLVKTDEGIKVGDCSPLKGFSSESFYDAQLQLLSIIKYVKQQIGSDLSDTIESISNTFKLFPSVEFALQSLLIEASLFQTRKKSIQSNALINCPLSEVNSQLQKHYADGYKIFKIKLGRSNFNDEIRFWEEYNTDVYEDAKFIFDANRVWTYDELNSFARVIENKQLLYFEDPLSSLNELCKLLKEQIIPIALDESLPSILAKGCTEFEYAVVKPTLLNNYERVIEQLLVMNKKVVLSSAFESFQGIRKLCLLHSKFNLDTHIGIDTYKSYSWDYEDFSSYIEYGVINVGKLLEYEIKSEHLCVVDLLSPQK